MAEPTGRAWWGVLAAGLALEALYLLFLPLPALLSEPVLGTLWPPAMAVPYLLMSLIGGPDNFHVIGLAMPALLFGVYGLAYLALRRVPAAQEPLLRRLLLGGAALFSVTLFFMPGLLSTDVYLYLIYGRMQVFHGLNPYQWGPAGLSVLPPQLVNDPFLAWLPASRTEQLPIYGPLWMFYCRVVVWLAGPDPLRELLLYRGLQLALALAAWVLYDRLLRQVFPLAPTPAPGSPAWRTAGLLLFVWNPLVQIEMAGEGHLDVLMIVLLILALRQFFAGRDLATTALLTLSFHTKLSVALVGAGYALQLARHRPARLPAAIGLALGLSALSLLPCGLAYLTAFPMVSRLMGTHYFNSFPLILMYFMLHSLMMLGVAAPATLVTVLELVVRKVLLDGVFGVLFLWRMWRLPAEAESLVVSLGSFYVCMYLFVAPYTWPHYMVLPLALLCLVPRSPLRLAGIVFSGSFMYMHFFDWMGVCHSTFEVIERLLPMYLIPIALVVREISWGGAASDTAAATSS